MSNLNNILTKNISSGKLRNYLHNELNEDIIKVKYDKICTIFHNEINLNLYRDKKDKYKEEELNIEHIVPKSYFKDDEAKEIMYCDMHNLFLCNKKLNSQRENFKYVDIDSYEFDYNEKYFDIDGNEIISDKEFFLNQGVMMTVNKEKKVIVPNNYSKGKIARCIAYFITKYKYYSLLDNLINVDTMIKWCLEHPVDNHEYFKNIVCYKYQGNYNPYVIDSELILYTFLDKSSLSVSDLLKLKKTKEIDHMESIKYLVEENNLQKKELEYLKQTIKNLEDKINED